MQVDKGVRDVLQSDTLFDCKPAIHRAFHYAKKMSTGDDKHGPDYLEFREFRLFLQTLRQYFEYFQAFARLVYIPSAKTKRNVMVVIVLRIDTGDDNRISKEEFLAPAVKESTDKWVGPIEDMEAEFDKIDVNGGGQILFSEFVDWAIAKNLDLEDDED